MKKRLTIYQLSRLAGVSIATISRAVNPHTRHKVTPETLTRLDALIARYGYTPSLAAKQLGGTTYRTIGVLVAHLPGVFFSEYHTRILAGVADALRETDYHFKLILLKPSSAYWDRYDFRVGEAVDGLIVTHWPKFFSKATVLNRQSVPCVVLNDPEPGLRAYCLSGDNRLGGVLAAQHLVDNGHRRLAVLAGPIWSSDSRLRIQGFRSVLRGRGVSLTMLRGDFSEHIAREVAEPLVQQRRVTAVFCCNDDMALGVLAALRANGRSCPADLSAVGYDDTTRAQAAEPPLTTIRVPLYDVAYQGTQRLLEHLQAGRRGRLIGQDCLPVTLVERRSVARRAR